MESKKPYLSKTLWMAAIVAVSALIPGVGEFVAKNVEVTGILVGGVFAVLRVMTKGKVSVE